MIAPVFLPGAETTEAVEKMTGQAMKWFAENVDNQPRVRPLPGEQWNSKKTNMRFKVSDEDFAAAARAGMTKTQAAAHLGLTVDHVVRRAKKDGITFKEGRGGRPWADRKDQT